MPHPWRERLLHSLIALLAGVLLLAGAADDLASAARAATRGSSFPYGVASGDVTEREATLWTRAAARGSALLQVATDRGFKRIVWQRTVVFSTKHDLTARVRVSGLEPARRYYYRFRSRDGKRVSDLGVFETAPALDQAVRVRFAYSAHSDGTVDPATGEPGWGSFSLLTSVRKESPDFFLYLGGTVDAGSPFGPARSLGELRAKYRQNRSLGALRSLLGATSTVAIWGAPEVGGEGTALPGSASLKRARQAFLEYLPVRTQNGKLYRRLRWGRHLEIFVLDQRSYRSPAADRACINSVSGAPDLAPALPAERRSMLSAALPSLAVPPPDGCLATLADPGRTLLGRSQKEWLKAGLLASDATFKVIAGEAPIEQVYADPYHRWEGYAADRAEILGFIRERGIRNVVFLAGGVDATLANVVREEAIDMSQPALAHEVVVGPIAAATLADQLDALGGASAAPALAALLRDWLGARCVVTDRFSYGLVEVDSAGRRLTIRPRDHQGRDLCSQPIVVWADSSPPASDTATPTATTDESRATPTATPTSSATPEPDVSATPTPSPTGTGAPSPTLTGTPTISPTTEETATATPTATSTPSPTPTVSPSPTLGCTPGCQPGNMIPNPSAEVTAGGGPAAWSSLSFGAASAARDTAQARTGSASLRVSIDATTSAAGAIWYSAVLPYTPGKILRAYLKGDQGLSLYLGAFCLQTADEAPSFSTLIYSSAFTASDAWTQRNFVVNCSAGTNFVRVGGGAIALSGAVSTQQAWFDDFFLPN